MAAKKVAAPTRRDTYASSHSDLLAAVKSAFRHETVEIPERGVTIHVRGLSVRDFQALAAQSQDLTGDPARQEEWAAKLIARTCFSADGSRLIPEGREDEVMDLPNDIVSRLMQASLRVCGLSVSQQEIQGNS